MKQHQALTHARHLCNGDTKSFARTLLGEMPSREGEQVIAWTPDQTTALPLGSSPSPPR